MSIGPLASQLTAPAHQPLSPTPAAPAPSGRFPLAGWPEKHDLDYLKVLVEVCLLIIGLPWILHRLATRPRAAAREAGKGQLG